MDISICYMVRNEILKLPRSIHEMKGLGAQVCIVDTGSTDGTVEYAKSVADKFARFKWCDDFSAARNKSLALADGDWILVLDADEWIDKTYFPKIREIIKNPTAPVFVFQILNFMQSPLWVEKPFILRGASPRLFLRSKGYKYEGIVHNKLNVDDETMTRHTRFLTIYNFAYKERDDIVWKCEQNKKLMDIKVKEQGWTFENCIHYSDIYRKLWTWKKDTKDGKRAVHYLNQALRIRSDVRMMQVRNFLLKEVQYVESKGNGQGDRQCRSA